MPRERAEFAAQRDRPHLQRIDAVGDRFVDERVEGRYLGAAGDGCAVLIAARLDLLHEGVWGPGLTSLTSRHTAFCDDCRVVAELPSDHPALDPLLGAPVRQHGE